MGFMFNVPARAGAKTEAGFLGKEGFNSLIKRA
jgi:hypothetical protein